MTAETVFPVPTFSNVQIAFGASQGDYLTREQMGEDFYCDRNDFTCHAQNLFFSGGSILPAGRRWRTDIDRAQASRAIKALLASFEPKHEIKIGTVGFALMQWTEAGVPEGPACNATSGPAKKGSQVQG